MSKPIVYITRCLPEDVVEPYRKHFQIDMWEYEDRPVDRNTLREKAAQADGLLTVLTEQVDDELLEQCKNLKIVANMAVGFDNIDVDAASKRNISVTNTPDVLTETTADLTFALMMATARRLVEASSYVKEGKWQNWSPLLLAGTDIHHKKIGIVGMGRIGEAVARRASGFSMDILYHNRSRKKEAEDELGATYRSLEALLEEADYVVCLTPHTPETEKMFDAEAFARMKKDAIFINASRGMTVDEDALIQALKTGEIAAAGLDVFAEEPIDADHPLLQMDNVVCLPHIGSATKETRYKMMELALENIKLVLSGSEPKTPVE
ncbi:2-hydroxyacid dehydrogenase [Thalassobacillus hwangdonensis]|uniref:2-hydroxyacid dehydrogenase n=1 Tax=Thalassobacillus hwangdonensis TaxID=546108 RepID=A0ABW3L345_9BACI